MVQFHRCSDALHENVFVFIVGISVYNFFSTSVDKKTDSKQDHSLLLLYFIHERNMFLTTLIFTATKNSLC